MGGFVKHLQNRVAVVTGGAGGIGRAMVERFLDEGMKVVVADIDENLLTSAVDELTTRGGEVIGVPTDVSRLESVENLRDRTLESFGGVHVVCNNAGVASGAYGRIWEHEVNDWRFAFSVHVYGVINGIKAFVPTLLERGDEGHVVNTSSHNGGFAPIASSATYATCKSAVVTISECLWGQLREVGSDIGVSVLFPSGKTKGLLDTGIWKTRERPAEYATDKPVDTESKMQDWIKSMEAAGTPVTFTPLTEVADTVIDGLLNDRFWMVEEGRFEDMVRMRADVMLNRAAPSYPRS
ncbi:MAG: SDR family NAD(P)-dependent oxidoreductase [Ilumatobacteraceae bacterium]|jgi:NAD(P)-dependent dehydrogenase (short-subunit alcohol dehydrogenase family)|nr:SDR family NAD(P)-dependent oxidoreductase [Actinomycetota bacterium]MDA3012383.1 SDR family NAD(P)-dependent oxidoreductase [Actinomycetota bacterium]MDA3025234.1 SDR family NAD(P)-dependent oxidoreductase [Actinomycetota bacterium]NBU56074.1 SDR family NAD(P)-dependent oxidoreductase [Acidimicrobiia bacterium]